MADWKLDYLHTVAEQIRWKRARTPLLAELEDHLESEAEYGLDLGLTPEAARTEALRQMGDAVQVGQELDRVHRPKPQWGLLSLTVLLAVAGALLRMVVARGSTVGEPERVLFYLGLGLAALFVFYFLDYSFLGKYAGIVYAGAVVLGIISLVVSPRYAGTSYYTRYFVVMLYPTIYAALVFRLGAKGWLGLLLALLALLPLGWICLAAPSFLGLLILLLTGGITLCWSIRCGWFRVPQGRAIGLLTALLLLGIGSVLFTARPALSRRLLIASQPALDAQGYGYAAMRITDALEHARLWGAASVEAADLQIAVSLVPGWDTDALLTSIICRLGWIPFGLLCAGLSVLFVWCLIRVLRQRSALAQLMGVAILVTLIVQAVCSMVMNLGFVLLSATCPFLMGNLHSVLDLALMGLLLSMLRQEKLPGNRIPQKKRTSRILWRSGELVIRVRDPDRT